MLEMNLLGGIDVGNGYVKGVVQGLDGGNVTKIDIPSGVALVMRPNDLPTPDDDAPQEVANDFVNNLDISFNTPLVSDNYRRLFGTRALTASGSFEEFNVLGRKSKAEDSLSKILTMGCFAAKALSDYVNDNGQLPQDTLVIHARVALALPIAEYMKHRVSYAAELKNEGRAHLMTIQNFETPVNVKIIFEDVQVIAEGASAQYAIFKNGKPLMEAMLKDIRSRGVALEGIEADDLFKVSHTIGIDVGEGTVNFVVFSNGKFNADASMTYDRGYGNALTSALETMESQGFNVGFSSRKQLADYLQQEPSKLKIATYTKVKDYVQEEIEVFAREIASQFSRVLRVVGAVTEVAFVYGGGAGPMKDSLYPKLLATVNEMNSTEAFPVLYLDARYGRNLNREGLVITAKAALEQQNKKTNNKEAKTDE